MIYEKRHAFVLKRFAKLHGHTIHNRFDGAFLRTWDKNREMLKVTLYDMLGWTEATAAEAVANVVKILSTLIGSLKILSKY